MINASNCMIASSSSSNQASGLKTHFKTPEGRYKLQYEKTHSAGLLHYGHGKTVTQIILAPLKDKQVPRTPPSQPSISGGGVRSAAARLLGSTNGSRALSFVSGNGASKAVSGAGKVGSLTTSTSSNSLSMQSFDAKGTYVIFNVGDAIFISDPSSQDKDPVKSIHFNNVNPVCFAFDPDARDGHDFVIGMSSGDVYSVSLRQQLQDAGKKLVGAQQYNKDCSLNIISRCTSMAWVPKLDGVFVVGHADGNLYVYDKNKDGGGDSSFPAVKDQAQFSVAHARYSKSNPIARWHICQGTINSVAFSFDGAYVSIVGRDGYLRVFDYAKEVLVCGGKSYYGALLCCSWSMDAKYILTGGEDDMVQIWSMEDRRIVAWGEGHSSWVSAVAFDPFYSPGDNVYRFGSVGQDTQLLLWDLEMDEIVVPLRRCQQGGSLPAAATENGAAKATLRPSPSMQDVPKLSPLVAHRVHTEPLSALLFTNESIVTASREGHVRVWSRPGTPVSADRPFNSSFKVNNTVNSNGCSSSSSSSSSSGSCFHPLS